MPLDPQARAVLNQMAAMGPPVGTLSPAEARKAAAARPRAPGPAIYKTEDRFIAGPGGAIPVRIYTPPGTSPFPALVYFHGGGWVLGSIDGSDGTARHLCAGAGCVVVSVDYRLAPENKFPAAAEDCYAATAWTAKNAETFGIDPNKIAVAGDSAGGNLAAAVPLMAKDRGGPRIAFQLLTYPVTDHDFSYPSYKENADGYLLTTASMGDFWKHYLASPQDANNPYAVPMKAKDLKGLPAALVITAEFDPLRDEGAAYAERLKKAGVPVTYTCYDGMIHGFFGMSAVMDKGKQAVQQACGALREAFAGQPARSARSTASAGRSARVGRAPSARRTAKR